MRCATLKGWWCLQLQLLRQRAADLLTGNAGPTGEGERDFRSANRRRYRLVGGGRAGNYGGPALGVATALYDIGDRQDVSGRLRRRRSPEERALPGHMWWVVWGRQAPPESECLNWRLLWPARATWSASGRSATSAASSVMCCAADEAVCCRACRPGLRFDRSCLHRCRRRRNR